MPCWLLYQHWFKFEHINVNARNQWPASSDLLTYRSELKERNVYDGHKAVSHLENKLVSKLLLLQIREPSAGPSFERLQVISIFLDKLTLKLLAVIFFIFLD